MAISYSQELRYTCPVCRSVMIGNAWLLIDTQERPDLRQALLEDTLNMHTCQSCASTSAPDGPLLLHDSGLRQVYFAVPEAMAEHIWREYAQDLLRGLLQALPEEQHLPYIGDVQLEQGLAGVRRALQRRARRTQRYQQAQSATPPIIPIPAYTVEPRTELADAVEALLASDNSAEIEAMLRTRPVLRDPAAIDFISTLIATAEAQSEQELAQSLRHARSVLLGMQQGRSAEVRAVLQADDEHVSSSSALAFQLGDLAYQALLHTDSPAALHDIVRDYPQLLEPWVETRLAERLETAIELGHEHLAALIDEKNSALSELRQSLTSPDALRTALRALAGAKTEETLLEAINAYPILLTELMQQELLNFQSRTLARGDEQRAALIDERRKMLDEVRQGLEK